VFQQVGAAKPRPVLALDANVDSRGPCRPGHRQEVCPCKGSKQGFSRIEQWFSRQLTNLLFSASKQRGLVLGRPEDKAHESSWPSAVDSHAHRHQECADSSCRAAAFAATSCYSRAPTRAQALRDLRLGSRCGDHCGPVGLACPQDSACRDDRGRDDYHGQSGAPHFFAHSSPERHARGGTFLLGSGSSADRRRFRRVAQTSLIDVCDLWVTASGRWSGARRHLRSRISNSITASLLAASPGGA